jgi:hypothetical protein
MNECDDDRQSLWATVHTVNAFENIMSMKSPPTGEGSDLLVKVLIGMPWQLNAAFRLKPTLRTLINRGYVYRTMTHLREEIANQSDGTKQRELIGKLTRSLGLLEFGVAVNEQWYRRLDSLIASGEITKPELKKLLRSVEVVWDKSGELVVQRFHQLSRMVIGVFLILLIAFSSVLCWSAVGEFQKFGLASPVGWFFFLCFLWSLWPTWCVWWLGPRSWLSSKKLQRLLIKDARH